MTTPRDEHASLDGIEANGLIACSVCLRVLDGSTWIDVERAIAKLRSFELPAPPPLRPALCDRCTESIRRRRAHVQDLAA